MSFDLESAKRIARITRQIERDPQAIATGRGGVRDGDRKEFLAITAATGPAAEADYTDGRVWFKTARVSNDTGDAATAKTEITAFPTNHPLYIHGTATNISDPTNHTIRANTVIRVYWDYDLGTTVGVRYWFHLDAREGVPFVVRLTSTSGSAGTATTPASWIYTVKEVANVVTLATGKSPLTNRENGYRNAASYGLAYWYQGTLSLLQAYEPYTTNHCQDDEE